MIVLHMVHLLLCTGLRLCGKAAVVAATIKPTFAWLQRPDPSARMLSQ
jgi:hypothetical protein